MPAPPDEPDTPLNAFLAAFANDRETGAVRPLAEYLARFPCDDKAIARKYLALEDGATPEPPADRIAHYRKIRQIGRGGQGTVYLAEDTRLHRQVALKVMDPGFASDAIAVERFKREAEITSKLDHPGICAVYETGEDRGARWIAMRYVEGEPLVRKITAAKEGQASGSTSTFVVLMEANSGDEAPAASPPPPDTTGPKTWADISRLLLLFEDAARALHAAHEVGVIHRDIKPGNMMVAEDGKPVILDFGLAVDIGSDLPTLTMTGDLMGTKEYMSPEQIAAHRITLDRRTDVYSLGVSLFECLALRRPFEAPTREGLYEAIMTKAPPDLGRLNPAIPSDLRVVVATAIEKERDRRYQTAHDLAEELRRVRMREPIVAKPVGLLGRLMRWSRRNPALATTLLILLFVVVMAFGIATLLVAAEGARIRAEENAAVATVRSLDWDRLVDGRVLEALIREAETKLWPAGPERVPAIAVWLDKSRALADRLPAHRAALAATREHAKPYDDEARKRDRASFTEENERLTAIGTELDRLRKLTESQRPPAPDSGGSPDTFVSVLAAEQQALEAKVSQRVSWEFESLAEQFKHDQLAILVRDLDVFVGSAEGGRPTLKDVTARLELASTIRKRTIDDYATAWREVIEGIARAPAYGGLLFREQVGLIPLGPDPATGLFEFTEPLTGLPAKRDPGGKPLAALNEDSGLVFVLLPGGTFRMGAVKPDENQPPTDSNVDPEARPGEGPVHDVTLSPFFMSKYEMTQGQWVRFTGRNPSFYGAGSKIGGRGNALTLAHPVEQVSWDDCADVLARLGLEFPTEAQWEYSCRAGTTTPYWTGISRESLVSHGPSANLADQSAKAAGFPWVPTDSFDGYAVHAPVGSLKANRFGLHDVCGNTFEWCRDVLTSYTSAPAPRDGLRNISNRGKRVARGGSFSDPPALLRSAYRYSYAQDARFNYLGVRPARAVVP